MMTAPRLGLTVRRHGTQHPLGRIVGIVKKPFKGYYPGDLFIKKPNGDVIKVHRAWVHEMIEDVKL